MWLLWCVVTLATLMVDPGHSEVGLSSTSFSNQLRSGFTRLFQNGVEQPLQSPYILVNPTDFQNAVNPLVNQLYQQRPAPFGPQLESTFYKSRPRYHPPRSSKRPNDVLVVVVKTRSNCTANNGTESADPKDDDDDDDDNEDSDEKLNPDDEVESVSIVAGGTENGKEPSRCVWAILSCCAPSNSPIRYTCFDVLGCSSAFWNTNPCVPSIIQAALEQATKFYVPAAPTNGTVAPPTSPPPSTVAPAAASSNTVTTGSMSTPAGGASTTMAATSPFNEKPTSPVTRT